MTVEEFCRAAHEPKELQLCIGGSTYDLISDYTERVDENMMGAFGDIVVDSFICNEPGKYVIWIKEVPVRKAVSA